MILSEHALKAMKDSGITEEEVKTCIINGELEIKQIVKGEVRYGKRMDYKDKTIIVIYLHKKDEEYVITTYPVRRKRTWRK